MADSRTHGPLSERAKDPSQRSRRSGQRWLKWAYAGLLFIASFGALTLEIVGGRLIAPYVGMSLYSWTALIATVLFGLSLGHWIGGRLADLRPQPALRALWVTFGLAGITSLASLPILRAIASPVLSQQTSPLLAVTALALAAFFLPSFFIGAVSPIVTRLALSHAGRARGRVLGQMFAVGAIGSIAGTLATGFLFISWLGSHWTVMTVAGAYFLSAVAVLVATRPNLSMRAVAGALAVCTGASVLVVGSALRIFESACDEESAHFCIRVVDVSESLGQSAAVMVLDHLGHGINAQHDPTHLESSYLELTDLLVSERQTGLSSMTAFFIGGGAYTLPRAWAQRYPEASVTVAEIDPAVTRIARERLWLGRPANLRVLHQDARQALKLLPEGELFDLVVGDAFLDIAVPQHLITLEFAREVSARLNPQGDYVLTIIDGADRSSFLFASVITLQRVFPTVEVWADAEQLTAGGRITYVVLAGKLPTPVSRIASARGPGRTWVRWPNSDLKVRLAESDLPIMTDDFAPVDRLLWNVAN